MASTNASSKPFAQEDLDWIVEELECGFGKIPEDAIRLARQHSEQVVPRLIEVIQQAVRDVRQGNEPDGNAHFFALYLLAEFRAREALPAILEAVSLPDEGPFDLFGGAITSDLARILVALADDPADLLDTLIENPELNEYVRWEAAQGYWFLVRNGSMERKVAVERLGRILREATDRDDWQVVSFLISVLGRLCPHEVYGDIKRAYQRDLVDTFLARLEDIDNVIAAGETEMRKRLDLEKPLFISDTIEELSTWSSFQEKPKRAWTPSFVPAPKPASSGKADAGSVSVRNDPADSAGPRPRAGRNHPCPCGSGVKFKKCCGKAKARGTGDAAG